MILALVAALVILVVLAVLIWRLARWLADVAALLFDVVELLRFLVYGGDAADDDD